MSRLVYLFTTFDGRISRKDWWIGTLIILTIDIVVSYLLFGGFFARATAKPTLLKVAWSLMLLAPSAALMFKRLNDRGYTYLPGCISVSLSMAAIISSYFGVAPRNWESFGLLEWVILFPAFMYQFLIFLDNALLKGTAGPNQHGPDPLNPKS